MKRIMPLAPIIGTTLLMVAMRVAQRQIGLLQGVSLAAATAATSAVILLSRRKEASPIHKWMTAYLWLAALSLFIWPAGAGSWFIHYPAAALYAVLLLMAVGPPLFGREVFTLYFARKDTPAAVWNTAVFKTINHHLTALWAVLFLVSMVSGLIPGFSGLTGPVAAILFDGVIPSVLMIGIGVPANKHYPGIYQRKLGLIPISEPKADDSLDHDQLRTGPQDAYFVTTNHKKRETDTMTQKPAIVAVNGSPHAGAGNTALMIEMLRDPLARAGFDLEVIQLCDHEIEFCTGCAVCMEKGKCWIPDDHRKLVKRLLAADGIVLACPVYFFHVTAQMKTFLDRCLAFGHKPRPTWKPGLAISVSAGQGETQTADYLAYILRVFGAYSVGSLTAMAVSPGEFVGKETVQQRAEDLAGDLVLAIKNKRRYPATDKDLAFYQFMGNLVRRNKDNLMRDDYEHWQQNSLYNGFEDYIQQETSPPLHGPEVRKAWVKEMTARYKAEKKDCRQPPADASHARPGRAVKCRELLQSMPLGFNADAAGGLEAVYQFNVNGPENFSAHLNIKSGKCTFHDGAAANPGVVIKTPADVWLAISAGEMDGQQAFMSGKYTVEGDLTLLLKLSKLFSG